MYVVYASFIDFRAIINDSIDAGSQIPCIRQAMREGYAILLLNQNQTYVEVDGLRCEVRVSGKQKYLELNKELCIGSKI